ncbi:MAG: protein translocase subunit SecD [bacterium]|nr:protein translocase subunit SecD [bacterium]MDZ4284936.1 protein translocase subunit SecD [Patescibacteria group bacterium]
MHKPRLWAIVILLTGVAAGYLIFASERAGGRFAFKLGLDLAGGTQLVYRADLSSLEEGETREAMQALRDVVERRVNLFGVSEPLVQLERSSALALGEREERLIVELPGVTDIDEAVALIGQTPLLEFKLLSREASPEVAGASDVAENGSTLHPPPSTFESTGLTGRFLKRAQLQFTGGGQSEAFAEPVVALQFNSEGAERFAAITREHVGEVLAIFLDGKPITTPVIRDEITSGEAIITGSFTPEAARELVRDLNLGALPVPIELISTQNVGATLGREALDAGVKAGLAGLAAVAVFLIFWYRLEGAVASLALALYVIAMLALFKLVPVTLTAAGITGFILSLGMAVDANILIFERIKDERLGGGARTDAIAAGFKRAWDPIRDANLSSLITAAVLFWFGTSLVQGFALTFGIGVVVSMFTAVTISRTLLVATETGQHRLEIRSTHHPAGRRI